jgi:phosphoserine phosphatase
MTLRRSGRLVVQHPESVARAVGVINKLVGAPSRTGQGLAVWDEVSLQPAEVDALAQDLRVDAALVPASAALGDYRLLAFDMDSTLITIECIDEIAAYAGCRAEVAAITEAAMRGEITDYDESLRRRVALLAGLDFNILARVFDDRLQLSPGALELLAAARRQGLKTLLVSGGFTYFTDRLKAELGLDWAYANTLEVVAGKLTGRVSGSTAAGAGGGPVGASPIMNAEGKAQAMLRTCGLIGCQPAQAIALGDGANDLKMMALAGVSVAYHAKPIVRVQTTYAINHCGLDAILNLLPAD